MARLTDKAIELSESECEVLNQKITLLLAHLDEHPCVCITYFVPDPRKEGGKYTTHSGSIKSWDEYEQRITFDDNTQVKANEIIDIKGELFDNRAFWMHNLGSVFKQVINSFYEINNFSAFSASKNLQNSSIIQIISETLSFEIIWKSFCIICNYLIITYKDA